MVPSMQIFVKWSPTCAMNSLAKHGRTSARQLLPPSTNSGVECFVLGDDAFPAKHLGECLAVARES